MMKRLIILTILTIIILSNCAADQKRLVMLGFPKEYYELRGPVKECILEGFTYDKENNEWNRGIGDSNYPEKYIFNENGYLVFGEILSGSVHSSSSTHIISENGNPVERQRISWQNEQNVYPYERMIVDDKPWYVNTEANINAWYAWNKYEDEETLVVKCLIIGAFSFDEYLNSLTMIIKGDYSKKLKYSYIFIYRKDGSILKIIKKNKNEFSFDEDGNLINYNSGRREEESYEIISPERTIRKYLSNDKWSTWDIRYIRDEYGNWISKETLRTSGDWSARERITREISYFE